MNIRETALALLTDYEETGSYVNLSLSSHKADGIKGEERGFLTHLLYTTVERKLKYDYYISALAERSIDKIAGRTKNILRLGLCQILDTDSIPDFAAVNETVKLAKNPGERSFVNGVLRSAVRQKDSLPAPDRKKSAARYLSVQYSLPLHLVRHFLAMLPEAECESLFKAFNGTSRTDLTVNTLKITVDEYAAILEKEGYTPIRVEFSPKTLRIATSVNPRQLPGYEEGLFFVEDAASAFCAAVLDVQGGERVVDVCSAPGGKSFAIAIGAADRADVYSFDLHESKLSLITGGAERLGIKSVKASACDATVAREELFGTADAVLCDVPCSGLGVLAKKPDLRYKSPEVLTELPTIQLEILNTSAKYLKPGGRLVYSTCTLNALENSAVADAFLEEHPEFVREDFIGGSLASENGEITLYPHLHGTDGFYICKLRKNK